MNLVTGATGFIGAHIVRVLLERGEAVRGLVRESSSRINLDGLDVEIATGDLRNPGSLRAAMAGVRRLYHCAADYRLYSRDPEELYASNVEGTRNILDAAFHAGVERVVYTSSVGALGLRKDGEPADETVPVSVDDMIGHYKRSKFLAEREAESWVAKGLAVVIVNPSFPVGDLDVKPTPTGRMILDYVKRRMPAYVDTGLNVVDARDVAVGHVLAAERGVPGEKYILGHRNMTLREVLDLLAEITGLPPVRVRLPFWVPLTFAAIDTSIARVMGRTPRVSVESVRMSRHRMYFDASKAVRELGLPQTPVREALGRAVEWFGRNDAWI
jgi:dihydroflavonol-4-reductase